MKAFDVTDAIGEAVKAALTDGISKMLSDPALLAALTQTPATGDKPE